MKMNDWQKRSGRFPVRKGIRKRNQQSNDGGNEFIYLFKRFTVAHNDKHSMLLYAYN